MQNYQPNYNSSPYMSGPPRNNKPMMQRNFNNSNYAGDPLIMLQKQRGINNSSAKKKKGPQMVSNLSIEEGEQLLNVWRENNYADFNSWAQVAKAQVNTEAFENSNDINKGASKTFTCNLTLTFEEDPSLVMISNGFAKNKKDAKKMAIEKIVIELIQNGEIVKGLRSKDFLKSPTVKQMIPTDNMSQSQTRFAEVTDENTQKKVHKLLKRMQEFLKKDSFLEACEVLCQIVMKKKPDWNELSFIWSYALLKKNFSYVKSIIDLIQYKRVQPSLTTTALEEMKVNDELNRENRNELEEKAKKELLRKYGNTRLKSDNPYDILDMFNVEVNLPEIDPTRDGREITDEEANAEILKDPLAKNIANLFVMDPNVNVQFNDLISKLSGMDQNKIRNPTETFTDPKLLNVYSAVEANRLLHDLDVQFNMNKNTNRNNMNQVPTDNFGTVLDPNNPFMTSQSELYHKGNVSGYSFPSQDITMGDPSGFRIDAKTSREIKNPNVNYISYKLLNEFYDSVFYVGDLSFAMSVAEVLYTRIRLDDEEFINSFACFYYSNKKNMLVTELIESVFQTIMKNRKIGSEAANVDGQIEKVGNKYSQEVLVFTPLETNGPLESKILKRGFSEGGREGYNLIGEGEFVKLSPVLTSGLTPQQIEKIRQEEAAKSLQIQMNQSMGLVGPGQMGNNALNTPENILGSMEMVACVREIQKDFKIKLFVLPTKEQSEMLTQKEITWKLTKLTNRTTIDKTCEALEIFSTTITMSQPLLQIILSPPICNNNYVQQLAEGQVFMPTKNHKDCVTNLNISQQAALKSATTQLLTLIQGPPGTGKTTTAVEIVLEWLRSSSAPILACADSNIAVDRLYDEFMLAGIRAIRIGPGYDDRNDFKSDKNYKTYLQYYSARQYHNANNIRFGIIKRMIGEAQVVCATCVGSMSEYVKGMNFPRVIMDEVTQATEMSTLIPLIKGCQQLVLIGDHKQLPPTVISTFAQSKGMTISLFERLVKQGVQPNLLTIQYRMHPSIATFPSYRFYNNMLENGILDTDRPIIRGFNWPNPAVRVAFVNVKGVEQVYSSSIQNVREVEVVVEILMQLISFGENRFDQISIITPYDAQKRRIRNEVNIQVKKYPHLFGLTPEQAIRINRNTVVNEIDTVDGYQGMEREMIIFSAVRSNRSGSLGFLRDPRRLNVTLTRAKRGLVIVGDMDTLVNDINWREWVQWCQNNRVILHYK